MTASELREALMGVPQEALCGTIELDVDCWCDSVGTPMTTDHAAALQRDAMTDWLIRVSHNSLMLVGLSNSIYLRNGMHFETNSPTRLHALASACRYVAEQKGAEK